MDAGRLLDEVNRRDGSTWRLVERLPGGFQSGAYLLEPSAVLKLFETGWTDARIELGRHLIELARGAGWPTPAWLASGRAGDGAAYVITDFAQGSAPAGYDDTTLDALLAAVDMQAGLLAEVASEQDWSRYVRGVTFGGATERQREDLRQFSKSGAALVDLVDERCAALTDLQLPTDDLVHGDLCTDNACFANGVLVGLVDAQHLGQGTRAVDIAGMLRHAVFLGEADRVTARLREAGEAVAGSDVFVVCLAARILDVLSFGTRSWPQEVDDAIAGLRGLLIP